MNRIVAQNKAEVLITPGLASQISLLHNQCPANTEWSGLLVYKITKGSVDSPETLEIRCEACFPMDFGDATFTSFEGSEMWLDFFKQFPQVNPLTKEPGWFLGKIHSHHNMNAYHSGTDTSDLYENAPKLPLFLSLVVNYSCMPFAEIAISAEATKKQLTRTRWKLKNWPSIGSSDIVKEEKPLPTTYIIPCTVVYEEDAWFIDQIANVVKAKEEARKAAAKVTTFPQRQFAQSTMFNTGKNSLNTAEQAKFMMALAELLTLDNGANLVPYQALSEVSKSVAFSQKEIYAKAFKHYFKNNWFDDTFFHTSVTELDAIGAVESFLTYHHTAFITPVIKTALNELKDEYSLLRKV